MIVRLVHAAQRKLAPAAALAAALSVVGCGMDVTAPGQLPAAPVVDAPGTVVPPGGFTLPDNQLQLLPFEMRLARTADVFGLAVDDPLLQPLVQNRLGLGDHDYANGVAPDRQWGSARMTLWVQSILPLCRAGLVRERFAWPAADLPRAAWGRDLSVDEVRALEEELATVPAELHDETLCLAVLSSAEFVVQ